MSLHLISDEDLTEIGRSDISPMRIIEIQNRVRASSVPTCDMVNELAKRDGVTELTVIPVEGVYQIRIGTPDEDDRDPPKWRQELGNGPARILVVL
jgi:hypothetical protein